MSETVMLIAARAKHIPKLADCDIIGIDRGAYLAIREGVEPLCAIGDFDSVNAQELEVIKAHCPLEILPTHKDETDSEKGVYYALEQGYRHIILYGGLGGRMDHTLANLYLIMHRDIPLTLMDAHHCIRKLKKGIYQIPKRFRYLSFWPWSQRLSPRRALLTRCISAALQQWIFIRSPMKSQRITQRSQSMRAVY